MMFDTYSANRHQIRQKTRRAFLMSLVLHALAVGVLSFSYIQWYRPMLPSEPLVSEAIALTNLQRFHVSSTRKRAMPTTRRSTPTRQNPPRVANQGVVRPLKPTRPLASRASTVTLGTAARLPIAETSLAEHATESPMWKSLAIAHAQPSAGTPPAETAQGHSTPIQQTEKRVPQPVDRDARMGEALEGIAESVANGKTETAVDLVFLLDISGSMVDNIRAVGRQLNRMVTVFEEKAVDFTLGIVIFRYLEDDTIIHPQTRDSERYKRLLTSHVVAAAGDERAHNAIIKTIRRVDFREGANRRFVLVTDEASKGSYSLPEVLTQCLKHYITVDVIGINHTTHRALTVKTGGLWFPIPIQE